MEIINYKLKDFLKIDNLNKINEYLFFLELLKPKFSINNPNFKKWKFWDKKQKKKIEVKLLNNLKFNQVIEIRLNFNNNDIFKIIDSIKIVTNCTTKEILNFTILDFYSIINCIKQQLIQISNLENNLIEDNDNELELINAYSRMSKFAEFNTIDSLANGDILKWEAIGELPYKMVFTKLLMDKEKHLIQNELNERNKRKMK